MSGQVSRCKKVVNRLEEPGFPASMQVCYAYVQSPHKQNMQIWAASLPETDGSTHKISKPILAITINQILHNSGLNIFLKTGGNPQALDVFFKVYWHNISAATFFQTLSFVFIQRARLTLFWRRSTLKVALMRPEEYSCDTLFRKHTYWTLAHTYDEILSTIQSPKPFK